MDEAGSTSHVATVPRVARLWRVLAFRWNAGGRWSKVAGIVGVTLGVAAAGAIVAAPPARHEVTLDLGRPPVFHPVADIIADLRPEEGRTPHLRVSVVVQVPSADVPRLLRTETNLQAAILAHLRDEERHRLVGRTGIERLRRDVKAIIDREIAPAQVQAVLFTAFLLD